MSQMRNDVGYLVSLLLLVASMAAFATGLVADLWDLNDFFYHRYAGYALATLAAIHVYLRWDRLVGYLRRRFSPPQAGDVHTDVTGTDTERQDHTPDRIQAGRGSRSVFSRRGFLGLALGGVAGFFMGRGIRPPDLPFGSDVGEIYHEWSKPGLRSLLGTLTNWGDRPALYKTYPEAERTSLPQPGDNQGLLTEDAIRERRSERDYTGDPMTLDQLSRLLAHSGGITGERWGRALRAAPSAGALYPIEVYPVVHDVEGLEAGLYHYAVESHELELLRAEDLRGSIVRRGLMQGFLGEANVVLVFTAIFQRLRWKYEERSYRYALLETGHLGQNAYLAATSMGLGACAVGAFLDDSLNDLLGVDGQQEAALHMVAVGHV